MIPVPGFGEITLRCVRASEEDVSSFEGQGAVLEGRSLEERLCFV